MKFSSSVPSQWVGGEACSFSLSVLEQTSIHAMELLSLHIHMQAVKEIYKNKSFSKERNASLTRYYERVRTTLVNSE